MAHELAEAARTSEVYAEEAFQACAPDEVTRLLDAMNMENASPAALEYAGALQEALKVLKEQADAGRKTVRGRAGPSCAADCAAGCVPRSQSDSRPPARGSTAGPQILVRWRRSQGCPGRPVGWRAPGPVPRPLLSSPRLSINPLARSCASRARTGANALADSQRSPVTVAGRPQAWAAACGSPPSCSATASPRATPPPCAAPPSSSWAGARTERPLTPKVI